jgi:hypothetical protein
MAKWGGAVACVVLLAAWIGSGWWSIWWCGYGGVFVAAGEGEVSTGWMGFELSAGVESHSSPVFADWRFWWPPIGATADPDWLELRTKLWLLLAIAASATAVAWRLDAQARRRERAGHCPSCDYDCTGVPAGAACPECGAGADVPS